MILADQIAEGASFSPIACGVAIIRLQHKAHRQHIDDAQDQHHQANRRDAEKAEAVQSLAQQFTVDHQVGRRRHQGHHPADKPGEAQRHHQPRWRGIHPRRDAKYHRDENGDHPGGAHKRAQTGDGEHQVDQHFGFAVPRHAHQPCPHFGGDSGAHQAIADNKQGGNQDHVRIAESGKSFI